MLFYYSYALLRLVLSFKMYQYPFFQYSVFRWLLNYQRQISLVQ